MKLYIWFHVEKKELPVQVLTTLASISPAHMKRVLLAVTPAALAALHSGWFRTQLPMLLPRAFKALSQTAHYCYRLAI